MRKNNKVIFNTPSAKVLLKNLLGVSFLISLMYFIVYVIDLLLGWSS